MDTLFVNLSLGDTKPLVLSLIPKYSDDYVPKPTLDISHAIEVTATIKLSYPSLLEV